MDEKQSSVQEPEQTSSGQTQEAANYSRRNFLSLVGGTSAAAALSTIPAAPLTGRAQAAHLSPSSPTTDLTAMSASQLARLIRRRVVSSVEVVQAYLDRIDQVNPDLNAVVQNRGDAALADAQAADAALREGSRFRTFGPLHGVPITIKDLFEVAGEISSAGTYGRRNFIPAVDATAVARLKAAGAIILGLTNVPELGQAITSDNIVYGRTNNPYDLGRTPGGSSGGEGAIIAAGGSPFGIGSDAGGSIRVPSHLCGIAGIKPTSGRASRTGHFPGPGGAFDRVWHIGPMSRHVEDLFLGLQLISGGDAGDTNIAPVPLLDPNTVNLRKLRIGYFTDNGLGGFATPTAETVSTVMAAVNALQDERVVVEEVVPPIRDPLADVDILTLLLEILFGDGGVLYASFLDFVGTPPDKRSPELQRTLELVAPLALSTSDFSSFLFLWDAYRSAMLSFIDDYDALVCPAMAFPAFPHPDPSTFQLDFFLSVSYTLMFNLTGWPGAVVRGGTSPEGLPIGVQVVAKPWREDVALAIAQHLEDTLGGWQPSPLFP